MTSQHLQAPGNVVNIVSQAGTQQRRSEKRLHNSCPPGEISSAKRDSQYGHQQNHKGYNIGSSIIRQILYEFGWNIAT